MVVWITSLNSMLSFFLEDKHPLYRLSCISHCLNPSLGDTIWEIMLILGASQVVVAKLDSTVFFNRFSPWPMVKNQFYITDQQTHSWTCVGVWDNSYPTAANNSVLYSTPVVFFFFFFFFAVGYYLLNSSGHLLKNSEPDIIIMLEDKIHGKWKAFF